MPAYAVHYAGASAGAIQMPHECSWLRVLDFDPLGVILPAAPAIVGTTDLRLKGSLEQPAVIIDNDVTRIFDYAVLRFPRISRSRVLQLQGNIFVAMGIAGENDPGHPIRLNFDSPIFLSPFDNTGAGNGESDLIVPMPKGAHSASIRIIGSGAFPITRVRVSNGWVATSADSGQVKSPWRPGNVFDTLFDSSGSGISQILSVPVLDTGVLAVPQVGSMEIALIPSGAPSDNIGLRYVRQWAYAPFLLINMFRSAGADNVGVLNMSIQGKL